MSLLLLFRAAAVTSSKTGTVAAGTKLAGADAFEATETGAVISAARALGADVREASENGAVFAAAKLAGAAQAGFVSKLGTVAADTTLAGADVFTAAETGTTAAGSKLAGTGTLAAAQKTGTVAAATWGSAADVYTATETGAAKAGTKLTGFTRSAPGPTGKFVLTNAKVIVAGTDVSRFTSTVSLKLNREEIDVTPLGSSYRVFMDGPESGEFTVDLFADPTVLTPAFWASLDAPVTVSVTPRNAAAGPDNPTWTGTAIAVRKTSLTGNVGDAAKASVLLHSVGEVVQDE